MLTRPAIDVNVRRRRKVQLVSVGLWALGTGRHWLVRAVGQALQREGLQHE